MGWYCICCYIYYACIICILSPFFDLCSRSVNQHQAYSFLPRMPEQSSPNRPAAPPCGETTKWQPTDQPGCTQSRSPPLWLICCLHLPPGQSLSSGQTARGYLCEVPRSILTQRIRTYLNMLEQLKQTIYPKKSINYRSYCLEFLHKHVFWLGNGCI